MRPRSIAITSKEQDNLYDQQRGQKSNNPTPRLISNQLKKNQALVEDVKQAKINIIDKPRKAAVNQDNANQYNKNANNKSTNEELSSPKQVAQIGQAQKEATKVSVEIALPKTAMSTATSIYALKEELKDLYKSQNTIPKLIEEDSKDEETSEQKLSDYYVKLQMVLNEASSSSHRAYANDKVSGEKVGIEIENIFSKVDNNHPETGRVLILGGAGVGKTTLLHYMAYSWASGTVWHGKFDYVFRVRLKELLNSEWKGDYDKSELRQDKLACFLHYCLKVQSSGIKLEPLDIASIATSSKDKILLLLDGYDEIAHLASSNSGSNSDYKEIIKAVFEYKNVIMSSRPNALDLKLKGNFERIIENKGLDEQGIYEYIDRKFSKDDKEQQLLGQELKNFLQKNGSVMDMCQVPINIALISLIWSDADFRAKFTGTNSNSADDNSSDFSLGQLYHEVIIWLGKRYMTKFGSANVDVEDLIEENILASNEVKFLTKVAHQSFVETGKLVPNKVVKDNIGQLNLRNVVKFGLLKPEGEGKDITKLNYQFIHLTFQEYLTAYHLKEQLGTKDKETAKEAAVLIAKHRIEPKYQMTLKFLAGLVASDQSVHGKLIATRFWEAVTVNIDGVIELGIETKVTLFMHLLSQSKIKGQFDSRIPNLEKIQQLIDSTILDDISKWQQQIVDSGYLSSKLIAEVKGIIEAAIRKGEGHQHLKAAAEIVISNVNTGLFGTRVELFDQFMSCLKLEDWQLQKLGLEKAVKIVDHSFSKEKLEEVVKTLVTLLGDVNLIGSIGSLFANIAQVDFNIVCKILSEAIKTNNVTTKKTVIPILTIIGKAWPGEVKEVLGLLSPLLIDKETWVREAALEAISSLAKLANQGEVNNIKQLLEKWLVDQDDWVRFIAAKTIGKLANILYAEEKSEVLLLLKPLLADNDSTTRTTALNTVKELLLKYPDINKEAIKEVFQFLKSLLVNEVSELKASTTYVIEGLAKYIPKEEVQEMLKLLKSLPSNDQEETVIYAVGRAIKEILIQGDKEEAIVLFKSLLVDENQWIRSAAADMMQSIVNITGKEGAKEILPLLKSLLADEGVRYVASWGVKEVLRQADKEGRKEILNLLKTLLADEKVDARALVAFVISEVIQQGDKEGTQEIITLLKPLLVDEVHVVRVGAIFSLKEIVSQLDKEEAKEILLLLKPLLDDQEPYVQDLAISTIGEIIKQIDQKEEARKILNILKPLLTNHLDYATYSISEVMKILGKEEALPLLKSWLTDKEETVKFAASCTLGKLAQQLDQGEIREILILLKALLAESNKASSSAKIVMSELAQQINKEGIKTTLPLLESWLSDTETVVRAAIASMVVKVIKNLSMEETKKITQLLKVLIQDQDWDVKSGAIKAIEEIASLSELSFLSDWLNESTIELRDIAKKEFVKRLTQNEVATPLTHTDTITLAKLIVGTKGSTDAEDKTIHDGAGKALQEIGASIDEKALIWLNEHFDELPNLPELAAFLKMVFHKTLSDGKIEEEEAKFLTNCILKKGITATFELDKGVIIFEDARYVINEGKEYLDDISEQAIENSADAIAKQYRDHKPLFVNTESVLEKAATDIRDVSIVDGKELKNNAWKITLLHKSNQAKGVPSKVFVLLERSSYAGEHILKKITFEKGKLILEKEYAVHPYRADSIREEIFGKMEYSAEVGKVRYFASEFEVELSLAQSKRLMNEINQGKIVVSGNEYQALHQFVLKLLATKVPASELSTDWDKYVAYSNTGIVQEFNKMQLLKTDSKQFYAEEHMVEVSSYMGKTDKRLQKLEDAHQAFAEFREKLSKNGSMPAEEKKLLLTRLSKIEEKLDQLGDPKEIVEYIATMNQEMAYNSDRVNDLENMVESLLGTAVVAADSANNNSEVVMLGHDTSA